MYTPHPKAMYITSMKMKRTQIYIDPELDTRLREAAASQGRSAASIIRDAVRGYLSAEATQQNSDPFLELAGAFSGGPSDSSTEHDRDLYGTSPD